ncbi:MAG: helix-turn-helix domain-containing protein, partial [Dehalococcoidia bacterium]
VMGSGHPDIPVAIETEPPADSNGRPRGVLSATDVATRLNVTPEWVRRKATTRTIGQRLGREWLFSEADVAALAVKGTPGRPRGR